MDHGDQSESPKAGDDLEIKKVLIKCRVPLTDEQHAVYTVAHAEACRRLREMEAVEKARHRDAKKKIDEADDDAQRLERDVLEKSTDGEVEGREEWDYRRFEVRSHRLDTAEVTTRPMTPAEQQAWIDAHPEPEPPPKQPDLPFGKVPGEDELDEPAAGGNGAPPTVEHNGQRLVKRGRGRPRKGAEAP